MFRTYINEKINIDLNIKVVSTKIDMHFVIPVGRKREGERAGGIGGLCLSLGKSQMDKNVLTRWRKANIAKFASYSISYQSSIHFTRCAPKKFPGG